MKRNTKILALIVILAVVCSIASSSVLAWRETTAPSVTGSQPFERAYSQSPANETELSPQDTPAVVGQRLQERKDPELSRIFRKYDLLKLDPKSAASQVRRNGKLLLGTSAGQFDLQLAPHDIRSKDYAAQLIGRDGVAQKLPRTPVNTYKGEVKGDARAQARMTIENDTIEGTIITEGERYFLQPARALSRATREDEFVFYKGSDLIAEAGTCGVTLADEVAAEEERSRAAAANAESETATSSGVLVSEITGLSPMKIVRLATDADAEYVTAMGGASQANSQIVSIMNQVDGIYQVEIGVTFQIVFQNSWDNATTDPYTTAVSSALLDEFRSYWSATFTSAPSTPRDLAHLWTGRDLMGGTIGIAYVQVVCNNGPFSYGLSQRFPFTSSNVTAQTVVLTTHEIGHNFSARHTNQVTSLVPADVEIACDNSIMEASVGSGMSFCPFSRSQIVGHANASATCLQVSGSGPPSFPSCSEIPIDSGLFANGALATTDCRSDLRGVGFFADRYSFQGTAGQQLNIAMTRSGGTLAPFVFLIGPDGYVISQNGTGISSAGISGAGSFTLPDTGKYIIESTSFSSGETGSYTVNVTLAQCTLSVSPTSQHFPAAGGNGTVNVTATGSGCGTSYQFLNSPSSATWLTPAMTGAVGSQALNFTVAENTNSAGRRAFLLVGPALSDTTGGLRIPITQSGTGPDCSLTPIAFGQTVGGNLTTGSCQSPVRGNNFYTDRYVFTASAGQQISILMSSTNADTFLSLMGPNGVVLLTDDDSGGGVNARIPGGTGFLTLGLPGTYILDAGLISANQTGSYTLTLTSNGPAGPPTSILTETGNTAAAAALDSVTQVSGPFTVLTPFNFSADGHRRIIFFTTSLGLNPGDNLSGLVVRIQGIQQTVEAAGPWSPVPQTSYIIVRLDGLPSGALPLSVTLNGVPSTNTPTINIVP